MARKPFPPVAAPPAMGKKPAPSVAKMAAKSAPSEPPMPFKKGGKVKAKKGC